MIPGTVAFSYAGAFGLSVLVWQHLIGLPLHWLVLPLTFIILVAVGSDYNLLLIVRVKEELHAGLHTGLIRALGSTGGVEPKQDDPWGSAPASGSFAGSDDEPPF